MDTTTATMNAAGFREAVLRHLKHALGKDPPHATTYDWRVAVSLCIRDQIVDPWFESTRLTYQARAKRVYYLSMEFLIGRLLQDAAANLGIEEVVREAVAGLGLDFADILSDEPDAALGNGGLGRLAACFMDSLATVGIPAYGYGIRYEHGLFRQHFEDGRQIETAEDWLTQQHVWEFERPEVKYEIGFGGKLRETGGPPIWLPGEAIIANAYDTPVIGWRGRWGNTLRLWSAKPTRLFDLDRFNQGEYLAAAEPEALARTISRVLYPDDTTEQGKELRLKQEYFFTAASIQDIVRRFLSEYDDLRQMPDKVAIQLNDTHPAVAAPELVRLLTDMHGLEFEEAAEIARGCISYTNHTLLPEALETWPVELFARILPRHMQIVERIDDRLGNADGPKVRIVSDGSVKMGELAFVTSHRVNGVSALHTELMKSTVFERLHAKYPDRIVNETNGITPRRWLYGCNRPLRDLVNEAIGMDWPGNLDSLEALAERVDEPEFVERFAAAKRVNKERLTVWLAKTNGIGFDPDAMFDVHVKRIHEYKRQLMNILETIAYWNAIRQSPSADRVPRLKIFAGKAAPGYAVAKQIIHLINDVASVINSDTRTCDLLRIAYPENYNVSMAELLIPAADLSEQISTAGKEASGTGNMKFALNGALTIGTLDGANVEIRERVGPENFFLFGMTAQEVERRREVPDHARQAVEADPRLAEALQQISDGLFSPGEKGRHRAIVDRLFEHDHFLVASDFTGYFEAQRRADEVFAKPAIWHRMALLNTARVGWFSSDRTIGGYARDIWNVRSVGATR